MIPPIGYRYLQIGEIIQPGDVYWSSAEKWETAPVYGSLVTTNGVIWARRRE